MTWDSYNPIKQMSAVYAGVSDDDTVIPTTDEVAWEYFHEFRWVYNKMDLCETLGVPYGPIGTKPSTYPVCVKPIINLMGGSVKSQVCHNPEEYAKVTDPGLFWSSYAMGDHYSVDYVMCRGVPTEYFAFYGEKLQHGAFDFWSLQQDLPEEVHRTIYNWLEENLEEYTGIVNIEIIGHQIIEAQLRMGDLDRLGDATLMEAIHTLYSKHTWEWTKDSGFFPETFYLAALFAQPNTTYHINTTLAKKVFGDLTYYQIDDPNFYHTNPAHGNRIAIFCDQNWEKVARARNIAVALFTPDIDGKYVDCLRDYEELRL